jgi:hypothetical protein
MVSDFLMSTLPNWGKWRQDSVGFVAKEKRAAQLLAEAQFADNSLIAAGIVGLEVIQQATPLADQNKQTAARAVIFLVGLKVLRQMPNTLAQQSDLHFRASGIGGIPGILVNERFLLLWG